jgi:phage/plasmid-associated DNA primase
VSFKKSTLWLNVLLVHLHTTSSLFNIVYKGHDSWDTTQNRTASTLEQLINSRFETARLFNKKICTMGEINYTLLDRTAILKMLSGGDPIPGEMKNKAPFDFVNTAKLLINTNSLPQTSDKTDAFYSRCILVEFGQQFQLGKDIIETIPQEEYDNFLTKSLRVLRELLDRGEFTNEGDIRAKEVEYERLSNPLTQFISTNYEPDPNGTVAAWRIFEKYVAYCIEKGYRKPQNQRDFNNMLKINYEVEKKNKFDEEVKDWVNWVWVLGIKLKDLPHLPNLPDVPLRLHIELSNDISGKSGKSGKSNNEQPDEKLPFDTIIQASKTGKYPVTELTKQLIEFQEKWGKGSVNSSNDTAFSLQFVDIHKPQWQASEETGYYTPSAIKGIVDKIFKVTPVVTS